MKKYLFLLPVILAISLVGHAQQTQNNSTFTPNTTANMKSAAQTTMAFNNTTGGNILTVRITNRVALPLSLTPDQKKSFNTALFSFFSDKNGFAKLKWSNLSSYQQQLNSLIQKLTGQLGAFLSSGQVDKFVSMRPASPRSNDPLIMVFY